MRVMVVYRDESDHARAVYNFLRDYESQTGHKLTTLDPDSRDGADFCRLYDVVQYPSVVAVSDNGMLQHMWQGLPLPLINEVNYYDKDF